MPAVFVRFFLVTLPILLIASSVFAQRGDDSETLTLDQAVSMALENNRNVRSAALEVEKSTESLAATRTMYFPQFDLNVLASQLVTPVDFTFERGVFGNYPGVGPIPDRDTAISTPSQPTGLVIGSIQQPLSQLYQISLSVNLKKTAREASLEEERQKKQEITNQVKKAYYAVLQSESALSYARHSVQLYRELERVTDDYLIQRATLKSDSLQVKAGLAKAQYQLVVYENEVTTRKEQLNILLGRDVRTAFTVSAQPEELPANYDLGESQKKALDRRPELREARLRVKQAEYDKRIKKSELIPSVSLSFNYLSPVNYEFVPSSIATVGLAVSWEIYDWGRKKHEAAEKERAVQQARLAVAEAENNVIVEVNSLHRKLNETLHLLTAARMAQEAAQEVVRVTANRYKENAALLKDVFQAETSLQENRDQYQQALLSFWGAKADFEKAMGEDR